MDEKQDLIISMLKHLTTTKKESAQPSPEEQLKEQIKELDDDINILIELIDSQVTQESIKEKIMQQQQSIEQHKKESHPYVKIFHNFKKSGKKTILQKRTAHTFELMDALEQQHLLHKYPKDLHNFLHIKATEKLALLKKRNQKYNS